MADGEARKAGIFWQSLIGRFGLAGALLFAVSHQSDAHTSTSTAQLKDWPRIKSAIAIDPAMEEKISTIISRMTVAQKVGQMTQPEIKFITPDDVSKYYLGSVLNGGGTWPGLNKQAKAADWVALADKYYAASMNTDMADKIPVVWGIDAIHGNSNVVGATLFPHNIGLGSARNPKLIEEIGKAVGKSVRATGINWVFAPTLAVGTDARWGRTYESFSEDGRLVKDYAYAYVRGLQGSLKDQDNVIATAKHFIGDGGTHGGVDRGVNQLSRSEMINQQAQGYYGAFAAGAQTVMASYNSWNDVAAKNNYGKMHGNRELLTEALKEKMGFDGFVVSDWDAIAEVGGCANDSCAQAINAGVDMVMVPDNWKSFIAHTIDQVNRGDISMSRIDDAVRRILRVKMRAGLFGVKPSENRNAGSQEALQAKDLARRAVHESLVLLKNNQNVLPIARGKKILVVGKSANSMINQSGGWSLTWQGTENKESDYIGDTILSGIKDAAGEINVHYSASAEGVDVAQFDVVIAVIGETPYAEGFGDIAAPLTLSHSQRFPEDLKVLQQVANKGKPVVTLFVAGRAVYANDLINLSDSFVAAWLPGSEGKAVADLLFKTAQGKVAVPFTGRLSFAWPRVACLDQAITKSPQAQLFSYGYGLKTAQRHELKQLTLDDRTSCYTSSQWPISNAQERTRFPLTITTGKRKVNYAGALAISQPQDSVAGKDVQVGGHHLTQLQWTAAGRIEASASFATAVPVSVQHEGALRFMVDVASAPQGKVVLSMDCGDNCSATFDLSKKLTEIAGKGINTIKIPLACFVAQGVKLKQLKTPFSLATDAPLTLAVGEVDMHAGAARDADALTCSGTK
ncbi:MAG: glycoside hydrolase family 3 C-terminal domain-containing protein [Burkholderiales bacterium]|nr:glycoside hydrolase family 3 C-terminal domain-containing protein [Burkholderiales bacterium]